MTKPIKVYELHWSEWSDPEEGEHTRIRFQKLSSGESVHIGVEICELAPGCNTAPAHYHMKEEEHTYVLSGAMDVRLGDQWVRFGSGEYLRFQAGDPRAHMFRNPFDEPCRYLMFGERHRDEVVVYPDEEKVHVRLLGGLQPYRRETPKAE